MNKFVEKTQHFWTYFIELVMCGFSGWLYEIIAGFVVDGRLLNRGFLHLPVCLIYGVFSLTVLALFKREKWRPTPVFFLSMIVVTVMEYISSVLIETVLGKRLWDYSRWICNFRGRISLISSIIFGIGCVLFVFWVHPLVNGFLNKKCKSSVPVFLGMVLMAALLCDYAVTIYGHLH